MNFFQPKIHFQGPKEGKAVSEFPILNFTAAYLWKIFGEHEYLYRLLGYVIYLTAIFFLFNLLLRINIRPLFCFLIIGIVLTSPLITYYCINFISDVPGFSIGLISFCFFHRFYQSKRTLFFYVALFLATLAVLIKASALIPLGIILFFSLIDLFGFNNFFSTEKIFKHKILPSVFLVLSPLAVFSWYLFALKYNDNNTNDIFLLKVLPIWEMQYDEVVHNSKVLFNTYLFPWFLSKPMFCLFALATIFVFLNLKSLTSFLKYSFIFSALFFVSFIIAFYQVFNLHDYYLINLMIFPLLTFICFFKIISDSTVLINNYNFFKSATIIVLVLSAFNCATMYRLRAVPNDPFVKWAPFVSEDEINLAAYIFWDLGNSYNRIENFTPVLRRNGIKRDDIILSIPDNSFNISLYFMDTKGFTAARDHVMNDSTVLDRFLNKKKNVKYVVLSDTTLKNEISFVRFEKHLEPLFIKDKIKVYKIKQDI